jgi:hypothetical protein
MICFNTRSATQRRRRGRRSTKRSTSVQARYDAVYRETSDMLSAAAARCASERPNAFYYSHIHHIPVITINTAHLGHRETSAARMIAL